MTKRFNDAVMKLYAAFHENRLVGMDCAACAVGNMCDNKTDWVVVVHKLKCSVLGTSKKGLELINSTGYSIEEISEIESIFMGHRGRDYSNGSTSSKDTQFKGLCGVVEYLAKLDNITNPMDYSKLFETENDKPKYQLESVLI